MKKWIKDLKETLPNNTFENEYLKDWQIKMRNLIAEIEELEKANNLLLQQALAMCGEA